MFEGPKDAQSFMMRVAAFYGALFVIYGMKVPFLPVWLDWRGMSASEISLIISAPFFARVAVTPALAVAADRNDAHRKLLITLAWVALATSLVLSQFSSFAPILVLTLVLIISVSTVMPMIETIAVKGVRDGGLDYGRMRLWGSLTFIAASIAGGAVVTAYGGGAGIWLIAIGCMLTVMAAHLLPRRAARARLAEHSLGATEQKKSSQLPFWQAPEVRALLAQPTFRAFLIAAGFNQAAHAALLGFGSLIWQQQGLSGLWIGVLWAIAVLAEVALFAVSASIVEKFGAARLLIFAAVAGIARWIVMAFEPGLALLVPLQALHALTYGASHIAAIYFLRAAVPEAISGTAQALYATVAAGLAMGVATLIAGWIFGVAGAMSYVAMVVASTVALVFSVRLATQWHGGLLLVDAPTQPTDAATHAGVRPTTAGAHDVGALEAREANKGASDAAKPTPVPLPPEAGIGG